MLWTQREVAATPDDSCTHLPPDDHADSEDGPNCGLQPSEADLQNEKLEEKRATGLNSKNSRGWRKIVRNFTPS